MYMQILGGLSVSKNILSIGKNHHFMKKSIKLYYYYFKKISFIIILKYNYLDDIL